VVVVAVVVAVVPEPQLVGALGAALSVLPGAPAA